MIRQLRGSNEFKRSHRSIRGARDAAARRTTRSQVRNSIQAPLRAKKNAAARSSHDNQRVRARAAASPRHHLQRTMVLYDLVDIWRETVDELGGLRGFAFIFSLMMGFTLVVQCAIGRSAAKRSARRMNAQRVAKSKLR